MSQTKAQLVSGTTAQDLTVDNINTTSINSGQASGNKNLIINGAMQVAQRGTSSTAEGFVVDRMKILFNDTDEAPTTSQGSISSSDTGPYEAGFTKYLRITNGNQTGGAGAADYILFRQPLEAQNIANSGWRSQSATSFLTLSFWVKSSVAQTFYGNIQSVDGTQRSFPFSFTLTAGDWKKVTVKIPGNTSPTVDIDNDSGAGLYIDIWPFAGTNYTASGVTLESWATYSSSSRFADNTTTWYTTNDATFDVTGVQLEVGSTATDFEHEPEYVTFTKCQRYFQYWWHSVRYPSTASNNHAIYHFPTPMRAAPTVVRTGNQFGAYESGSTTANTVSNSQYKYYYSGLLSYGNSGDSAVGGYGTCSAEL